MSAQANSVPLDVLQEFLVEAYEELSSIGEGLTQLESDHQNSELLNQIYRSVHTIKGAASFLQFRGLEKLTHSVENVLDVLRERTMPTNAEITDLLLKAIDRVGEFLKSIEANGDEVGSVDEGLVQQLDELSVKLEAQVIEAEPSEVPADEAVENLSEQVADLSSVAEPPLTVEQEQEADTSSVAAKNKVASGSNPATTPVKVSEKSITDTVVKVNVNLLDKIMNVVGELVLNRNQIIQFSAAQEIPELHRLANDLNAITTELQSDIMTTRMQPIGSVLAKFERVIRDLGRETGKKIHLKIEGKETELDRTILEAIRDPLTHLVRNAVDHGVEGPEERVAAGKSPEGQVTIRAYHEGGLVTIDIMDDGKGLSRSRVLAKAVEKKLVAAEKVDSMTDKQVCNLIFMPGFSTAEKVTNISGRGVGMDVVRTNVEKIGGQVEVSSVEGKGTTFKLKIPLTLAIIPAMIVESNNSSFAIPQANLVELVHLDEERVDEIEEIKGSEFFRLRGDLIPIIRLNKALTLSNSANESGRKKYDGLNIVVLNAESCQYGLIVEEIRDTQEIVVKPLSKLLKNLSVFAGATIMGDGSVALILDVMGFAQFSKLGLERGRETRVENAVINEEAQDILLFSLSSKSLFGVPLCLINRLEEVHVDKIELVGETKIVRYRDQVMPIIDLNEHMGYPVDSGKDMASVLVIHLKKSYFGLRVSEVVDIRTISSQIQSGLTDQKGILGTVFVEDQTVTMLDIYQFLEESLKVLDKAEADKPVISQTKRRILVVDDSPFFRRVGAEALREQGFDVLIAANGESAFQMLQNEEVDLVLSDIEMPVMNGLELARQIRGSEKLKHLPLVAVTTRFSDLDVEAGKRAGFQVYLEKFRKVEIVEAIAKLLN